MRITKLHLLLFFLLAGAGIYGSYFWRERQSRFVKAVQPAPEAPVSAPASAAVKALPPAPAPALVPEPKIEKPPEAVTYVVHRGDTLWKIAKMKEHFGKGHRWYDIWKANEDKISDFDHLRAGRMLMIPLDKPEGYKWPRTSESKKKRILGEQERNYN